MQTLPHGTMPRDPTLHPVCDVALPSPTVHPITLAIGDHGGSRGIDGFIFGDEEFKSPGHQNIAHLAVPPTHTLRRHSYTSAVWE